MVMFITKVMIDVFSETCKLKLLPSTSCYMEHVVLLWNRDNNLHFYHTVLLPFVDTGHLISGLP